MEIYENEQLKQEINKKLISALTNWHSNSYLKP